MTKRLFITIGLFVLIAASGCQKQSPVVVLHEKKQQMDAPDAPIAFTRITGDYWQIWTMQPDGSGSRQITTSSSDKRYPVWSTSGEELLFRDNNCRVFSIEIATGQEKQILTPLGLSGGAIPSPDGNKLLMVRYDSHLKDSSNLWLTKADGKDVKVLTRDAGLQYDPAWSPDGGEIAYIGGQGPRSDELYTIKINGTNKKQLTKNKAIEFLPAFSPDGDTIAYVSDVTGNFEIWLMDAKGKNLRQLTHTKGIDTRPCWSPDGSRIMFASSRTGRLQLWIMNADSSDQKQLTDGPASMDPAWRWD